MVYYKLDLRFSSSGRLYEWKLQVSYSNDFNDYYGVNNCKRVVFNLNNDYLYFKDWKNLLRSASREMYEQVFSLNKNESK